MQTLGPRGVLRGPGPRTTVADPKAARAKDLVHRNFEPLAPNVLWVADFTYVRTVAAWVYVAFVIDAYARRILGWKVSNRMTTPLVLDAINQAIWIRKTDGITDLSGLIRRDAAHVQAATADYLRWFNHDRLYEFCGDMPPVECEQLHYTRVLDQQTDRSHTNSSLRTRRCGSCRAHRYRRHQVAERDPLRCSCQALAELKSA